MRLVQQAAYLKDRIWRVQKGITGLETSIVLIAFVVVSSVFAYSVLNTGMFSADRSKESITAGMTQTRSNLELKGAVVAESDDPALPTKVASVKFYVSTAAGAEPIDFTTANLTVTAKGSRDNGDNLLDPGELREVQVALPAAVDLIANELFNLELRPPVGSVLNITRSVEQTGPQGAPPGAAKGPRPLSDLPYIPVPRE